jgi:Zn-dependent protease
MSEDGRRRYSGKGKQYSGPRKAYSRSGRQAEAQTATRQRPPHALGWVGKAMRPELTIGVIPRLPIHLSWTVLVFAAIVGALFTYRGNTALDVTIWVATALFAVFVHELGHAAAATFFKGAPVSVTLHAMGGFTRFRPPATPWPNVAIALAGPFTGLALGGLSLAGVAVLGMPSPNDPLRLLFYASAFWNLLFNLLNLLPIYPLDGGHTLLGFLRAKAPHLAIPVTAAVGAAMAVAGLVLAAVLFDPILAVFAVVIGAQNGMWLLAWRRQRLSPL